MKRIYTFFTVVLIAIIAPSFYSKSKSTLPNIILIYLDDMGYGDLGVTGALEFTTPNIDKLASEGMRFTNFHTVQAVCSASRAALLTGCYPNRLGISGALFPFSKTGLNPDEMTIAELVKQKGYRTAIFGKWHLGDDKRFLPLAQGFDQYYGIPYSNDMWPVQFDGTPATREQANKFRFPVLPLISQNDKAEEIKTLDDQALLTKKYTDKAIGYINAHKSEPFFLYLPHSMPHVPIAASSAFKGKSKQGTFGDVMMEIDWSIGEIMKTLDALKLSKNTILIFSSDNGPWLNFGNHAGSTSGLREGKGSVWEGGHRVPCIIKWPGVVPAGIINNKLTATIDLFPTIASICKVPLPAQKIDGIDLLPMIKGDHTITPRKYLYYYYNVNSLKAVRRDDWKLMLPHTGRTYSDFAPGQDGFPGAVNENAEVPLALYDLRRDPGERYNVMVQYPEIVKELQEVAELAREDLGDVITGKAGKNQRLAGKIE